MKNLKTFKLVRTVVTEYLISAKTRKEAKTVSLDQHPYITETVKKEKWSEIKPQNEEKA